MEKKVENLIWKCNFFMESIIKDEEGDSNMVAVIVLIVIVLAAAAIFRTQLLAAVNSVFEQLTDFMG